MKKRILPLLVLVLLGCSQKTPEQHLQAADQFIQSQDLVAATIELKNAIQLSPEHAEARFKLGKIYLETQQYAAAEKELNRAIDLGYSASQTLPLLSLALEKSKADVALSTLQIEQRGMNDDEAVQVAYFKLQSLLRLDKKEDAQKLIRRIKLYNTESPFKALALAYELAINKQLEDALAAVEQVLEQVPAHEQGLPQKAMLQLQLQRLADAAETYKKYLDYHADDTEITFILTKLWMDLGETDKALPLIDKLLKINPTHGLLNQYKSLSLFNDKQYAEAYQFAEVAIKDDAASPARRLIAGYSAYALQDYKNAEKHLAFTASLLPNGHPALRILAVSQLKLGLSSEAGDTLTKVGEVDEELLPLFASTSYELLKSGQISQARNLVEMSASLGSSANDLAKFGVLQLSLNDVEGISKLERAIEMDPALDDAQASLAVAYLNTNQLDKAKALAEKWQLAAPQNIKPILLQGMIMAKQGQAEQATKFYQKAAELAPDNPTPKLLLIELKAAQGQVKQAISDIKQLLDANPKSIQVASRYASLMAQQQKIPESAQKLRQLHTADADNAELALLYAATIARLDEFDNVLKVLNSIKFSDEPPELYNRLRGIALLRSGDISKAEDHFNEWLTERPENKHALAGKLSILEAGNQNNEALALINDKIKNFGTDDYLRTMLVQFQLRLQQYDQALIEYNLLPAKIKDNPIGKGFLAHFNYKDQKNEEGVKNALEAYNNKPNAYNVRLVMLGYNRLQQQQQGYVFIQQHMQQHPSDVVSQVLLAEYQLSMDREAAIATYEDMVNKNDQNFLALNNLAFLYNEQNKLPEAEKYARKAVALLPDNPDALDTLGHILLAKGDNKEGIAQLAKAAGLANASEEVQLNYIDALINDKQHDMAQRHISRLKLKQDVSKERLVQLQQRLAP
ncbi:PEP-CTERM system TPR-repeat protein PrsT [Alteromonadaceae bacterium BrNp21-10]|nr:PEP-CTERM system TPR-repeat protein PrsT [Alteromonadaceae bacterium BrNp21-10]